MNDTNDKDLRAALTTVRLILAGMAVGALAFGLVCSRVLGPADGEGGDPAVGAWMARGVLLFGLVSLVVHRLVGSVVSSQGAKNLPPDAAAARRQLLGAYQTGMIVSAAILEQAIFLCLVFYAFIEGEPTLLAMAGLLWMAMLIKFPWPEGVAAWVDQHLRSHRESR